MKDILQEIVAFKRIEVEQQKQIVSPRDLYARVEKLMADGITARSMSRSLAESPYGIIDNAAHVFKQGFYGCFIES